MTRTLRTDAVEVELGRGWWRGCWPGGAVAGPFTTAGDDGHGRTRRADAGAGAWRIEIGTCGGRPGSWARWRPAAGGPAFAVHVPAEGPLLVVETAATDAEGDDLVAVLVDSPGDPAGDPAGDPGASPGDRAHPVAVARGRDSGVVWAAIAAGPDASRLVSSARR
jgi:hypothetical protein